MSVETSFVLGTVEDVKENKMMCVEAVRVTSEKKMLTSLTKCFVHLGQPQTGEQHFCHECQTE